MNEGKLLTKVKLYCTGILENSKCKNLPFHNLEHTEEIVINTKKILAKMTISAIEAEAVVTAA